MGHKPGKNHLIPARFAKNFFQISALEGIWKRLFHTL